VKLDNDGLKHLSWDLAQLLTEQYGNLQVGNEAAIQAALPAFLAAIGAKTDTGQNVVSDEHVGHNHDQSGRPCPESQGKALAFGRKKPEGECRRCDQLRAGAKPRLAPHGLREGLARASDETRKILEIRAHFAPGGGHEKCGSISTCYDA
jgi:hypothetical protein